MCFPWVELENSNWEVQYFVQSNQLLKKKYLYQKTLNPMKDNTPTDNYLKKWTYQAKSKILDETVWFYLHSLQL